MDGRQETGGAIVTCTHEESVTSTLDKGGRLAEVTVCAACSHVLDYRPLREIDVAGSEEEMPAYEAAIQAQAKAAKAREIEAEAEASAGISATPTGRQADELHKIAGNPPPGAGTVEDVMVLTDTGSTVVLDPGHRPAACAKHGGGIKACDTGVRRAHNCHHSKWGKLRTFNSPCPCAGCHDDA
jgi:hypothetical protein